jgi:hypothetical protein
MLLLSNQWNVEISDGIYMDFKWFWAEGPFMAVNVNFLQVGGGMGSGHGSLRTKWISHFTMCSL